MVGVVSQPARVSQEYYSLEYKGWTLRRLVAESKPGDELKVELQRDEKEMAITVKIEARRWRR